MIRTASAKICVGLLGDLSITRYKLTFCGKALSFHCQFYNRHSWFGKNIYHGCALKRLLDFGKI